MTMARDRTGRATPAESAGQVSTRRLLAAFVGLLTALALLLHGASLLSARLRPPLERVPAATYAARQGIALPPNPAESPPLAPPGRTIPITSPVDATAQPSAPQGDAPTPPPAAAEAVAAYLRAWEIWAEACLTLDPAPLERAFAQPELDRARAYVRQLGASGRLLRLAAAHRVTVLEFDGDTALLMDERTDRSLYLDPATRHPLPSAAQPTPVGAERVYCRLLRTASGWRVSELIWGR
jgi:hypothetical protein